MPPDLPPETETIEQLRRERDAALARAAELEDGARSRTTASGRRRVRGALGVVLLVLGALLTPVSIVGIYARTQVTDREQFVATMTTVAADPTVQAYLADVLTERLLARVDVERYVREVLPDRAAPLAGPMTGAIEGFVRDVATRLVASETFLKAWVAANRMSHEQLNNLLYGIDTAAILQERGIVYVDLGPIARTALQRLKAQGLDLADRITLERVNTRVPVFESRDLFTARDNVRWILKLAWVMPFFTVGLLLGSAWLAGDRRRGMVRAAVGFAVGALLLAAALAIGRGHYLDAATTAGIPDAPATVLYDALLAPMQRIMRVVLTISLVIVASALLAGPSRPARWVRRQIDRGVTNAGALADDGGWRLGGSVAPLREHVATARAAIAVAWFATMVWWDYPTPTVIAWLTVVAAALLLVVEFYARPVTPGASAPQE